MYMALEWPFSVAVTFWDCKPMSLCAQMSRTKAGEPGAKPRSENCAVTVTVVRPVLTNTAATDPPLSGPAHT